MAIYRKTFWSTAYWDPNLSMYPFTSWDEDGTGVGVGLGVTLIFGLAVALAVANVFGLALIDATLPAVVADKEADGVAGNEIGVKGSAAGLMSPNTSVLWGLKNRITAKTEIAVRASKK